VSRWIFVAVVKEQYTKKENSLQAVSFIGDQRNRSRVDGVVKGKVNPRDATRTMQSKEGAQQRKNERTRIPNLEAKDMALCTPHNTKD